MHPVPTPDPVGLQVLLGQIATLVASITSLVVAIRVLIETARHARTAADAHMQIKGQLDSLQTDAIVARKAAVIAAEQSQHANDSLESITGKLAGGE